MPGRSHPLITGEYYHVYNKTIDGKRPLDDPKMLLKLKEIVWYYRSYSTSLCYADFLRQPNERKLREIEVLTAPSSFRVTVLAYCFMPTHFHFLLKQVIEGGISMFISQIQNSFTRYFNTLHSRKGSLFIHPFKSRPVESNEDLKHLSRYIHLNPYSSGIVSSVGEALAYDGSSFSELSGKSISRPIVPVLYELPYIGTSYENYRQFVIQNAEYQKSLERIVL